MFSFIQLRANRLWGISHRFVHIYIFENDCLVINKCMIIVWACFQQL